MRVLGGQPSTAGGRGAPLCALHCPPRHGKDPGHAAAWTRSPPGGSQREGAPRASRPGPEGVAPRPPSLAGLTPHEGVSLRGRTLLQATLGNFTTPTPAAALPFGGRVGSGPGAEAEPEGLGVTHRGRPRPWRCPGRPGRPPSRPAAAAGGAERGPASCYRPGVTIERRQGSGWAADDRRAGEEDSSVLSSRWSPSPGGRAGGGAGAGAERWAGVSRGVSHRRPRSLWGRCDPAPAVPGLRPALGDAGGLPTQQV